MCRLSFFFKFLDLGVGVKKSDGTLSWEGGKRAAGRRGRRFWTCSVSRGEEERILEPNKCKTKNPKKWHSYTGSQLNFFAFSISYWACMPKIMVVGRSNGVTSADQYKDKEEKLNKKLKKAFFAFSM